MGKIKALAFLFRILFIRRAFFVSIIFYFMAIMVFFSFNVVKKSLHGVFWRKIRTVYPYGYLIPDNGLISLEKANNDIKKLKDRGINYNAVYSVPALIEKDDGIKGVMVSAYVDINKKMENLHLNIDKGLEDGICVGSDVFDDCKKNDDVTLYFRDKNLNIRVSSFIKTGFYDIDSYYVYMSLEKFSQINGDKFISEIEIADKKGFDKLSRNIPKGFYLESFWERNPELFKAYNIEKLFLELIDIFFIVVFILAVINIYRWLIQCIQRSLDIMRLMGISNIKLFLLLIFQSMSGFHLGLFLSLLFVKIFSLFYPIIHVPVEVYGINGIKVNLVNSFDIYGYILLLFALFMVNIVLYFKLQSGNVISKLR